MSMTLYIDVADVIIDTTSTAPYPVFVADSLFSVFQLNKLKGCTIHLLYTPEIEVIKRKQLDGIFTSEGLNYSSTMITGGNQISQLLEKADINDILIASHSEVLLQQGLGHTRKILFRAEANEDTVLTLVSSWPALVGLILGGERKALVERNTYETRIKVEVNLDQPASAQIKTGIGFFDHMLEQIAKHANIALVIETQGDLHVDEHHTMEDTALALGEAFRKAVGDKRGMERYGFALPMDDCSAQVLLDFGGRPWLVWDTEFKREKVGDMPTEMFLHFFKSFSDAAQVNLNVKAEGQNEHHKIEGIFKAFARAIKMAIRRDVFNMQLPSTKGVL